MSIRFLRFTLKAALRPKRRETSLCAVPEFPAKNKIVPLPSLTRELDCSATWPKFAPDFWDLNPLRRGGRCDLRELGLRPRPGLAGRTLVNTAVTRAQRDRLLP